MGRGFFRARSILPVVVTNVESSCEPHLWSRNRKVVEGKIQGQLGVSAQRLRWSTSSLSPRGCLDHHHRRWPSQQQPLTSITFRLLADRQRPHSKLSPSLSVSAQSLSIFISLFLSFRDLVGLGSLFLSLSLRALALLRLGPPLFCLNETTTANHRQAIPPTPRLYTSTSLSPLNPTAVEQPCRRLNNPDNRNLLYPSVPRQEVPLRTG